MSGQPLQDVLEVGERIDLVTLTAPHQAVQGRRRPAASAVRTLRVKGEDGRWQKRTPVMAAGLADPVWSPQEWLRFPAV
jgi:hypothetical protein